LEWIMPMKRSTATLRINPEQLKALENISEIEGLTVNELLREAVKTYLNRRDRNSFEGTVSALRAYRKQNPGFKGAIDEFVDAEVGVEDPLECELIEAKTREQYSAGPVQRKIRDILDS
jgi:Ribbon-helix-helix protein, copG family